MSSSFSWFLKFYGKNIKLSLESILTIIISLARKLIKDTQRGNIPSNKTQTLTKSTNMDIWLIGTLNQLFIRGFYAQNKFSKKQSS